MLYRLSYASRWKQVPSGAILPRSLPEVRDNYLSYHKGNSRATGSPLRILAKLRCASSRSLQTPIRTAARLRIPDEACLSSLESTTVADRMVALAAMLLWFLVMAHPLPAETVHRGTGSLPHIVYTRNPVQQIA